MISPLEILKKYWKYNAFRPLQEDIINSVLSGNDTLALLPTGGGKSICFQVPALAKEGICLVISPLISLMKDQVENLKAVNIAAEAIYSGLSYREIDIILDNCIYGKIKFLYVSPERLQTDIFQARIVQMNVNLIAIDEAHCISEWGYDFRPSYLKIAGLRDLLPDIPMLALTASATPNVKKDIQEKLNFSRQKVFEKSFDRKNLVYGVVIEEDKRKKLLEVIRKIPGTGIIYVRKRKSTEYYADFLKQNGIQAMAYHAGLPAEDRTFRQEAWKTNRTRVIIATTAFGMGIDKPDVRFVIHLDLPESLEAYYQEAGRAGRDEKKSYAVGIINQADKTDLEQKTRQLPEVKEVKLIYQAIGNYLQIPVSSGENESFPFDLRDFSTKFNFIPNKVYNALKLLENEGYITFNESVFLPSRLKFIVDYKSLYEFEVAHEKFEPLIKTILRLYGGSFDQYVNINESEIGKKTSLAKDEIIKQLQYLHKLQLLDYLQQNSLPQLFYLTERLDAGNMFFNIHHISKRKEVNETRAEKVTRYFYTNFHCRNKMILNYFGESVYERCNHCDFCLRKDKMQITEEDRTRIHQKLIDLLAEKPLSLNQAVFQLQQEKEKTVIEVIRWMIDEEQLLVDEEDQIQLAD